MLKSFIAGLSLVLASATAFTKQEMPAVSHDGLHLMPDTKVGAVYMKPGADLSVYDKIALLDTYVAFRKHWKRDHNSEASFQERVSDKDMARIKKEAAAEFAKVFTEVLSTKGGHELVSGGGDGVLILRPALLNLDVTAPDMMTPGISHTIVSTAGSVTLYLELYDGKTGDIIARIMDARSADEMGMGQIANKVTNKADFDRVLRRWAELLNDQLSAVKK